MIGSVSKCLDLLYVVGGTFSVIPVILLKLNNYITVHGITRMVHLIALRVYGVFQLI